MNLFTKQKQTHRHRKQTQGYQKGRGRVTWEYAIFLKRNFTKRLSHKCLCTFVKNVGIISSHISFKEAGHLIITSTSHHYIKKLSGFPGGAVVENLPANAGDTGPSPGLGRSHMPRSSQAREPQLLSLRVWSLCSANKRGPDSERPAHHDEEWPPLATTRESPRTETKTQHSQK